MKIYLKTWTNDRFFGMSRTVYENGGERGAESGNIEKRNQKTGPDFSDFDTRKQLYEDVKKKVEQLRGPNHTKKDEERANSLESAWRLAIEEERSEMEGRQKVAERLAGRLESIVRAEQVGQKMSDSRAQEVSRQLTEEEKRPAEKPGNKRPTQEEIVARKIVLRKEERLAQAKVEKTTLDTGKQDVLLQAKRDELFSNSDIGTFKSFYDKEGREWRVTVNGSLSGPRSYKAIRVEDRNKNIS